jgi:hypothetical protein
MLRGVGRRRQVAPPPAEDDHLSAIRGFSFRNSASTAYQPAPTAYQPQEQAYKAAAPAAAAGRGVVQAVLTAMEVRFLARPSDLLRALSSGLGWR